MSGLLHTTPLALLASTCCAVGLLVAMQLWVMLRGSPRLLCGVGGVRVDQTDSAGDTALSHSCCAGQAAVLATLLQAGARPDTQDRDGVTPLHKVISHSAQIRETRWLNSCRLVQVVGDIGGPVSILYYAA